MVVNAYEAKHAGSIEEGSEGEAEARQKVADDLGKSHIYIRVDTSVMVYSLYTSYTVVTSLVDF